MAEWPNVPDSKSGVPQGTEGSNPSLSVLLLFWWPIEQLSSNPHQTQSLVSYAARYRVTHHVICILRLHLATSDCQHIKNATRDTPVEQ